MADYPSDVRQRRAPSPPRSHAHDAPHHVVRAKEASPSPAPAWSPLPSLASRWRHTRASARLSLRIAMSLVELLLTACAMLVLPSLIQRLVRCADDVYEVVGRRARSRFEVLDRPKLAVGAGLLAAWHIVLVVLSWRAAAGDRRRGAAGGGGEEEERAASVRVGSKAAWQWGRVLHRILVPAYLFVALAVFLYNFSAHLLAPVLTVTTSSANANVLAYDEHH